MKNLENEIKYAVHNEILNPEFEMTRQYLKILEIEYENESPKILKIEHSEYVDNLINVYIALKDVSFFLQFTFAIIQNKLELHSVDTAPNYQISYNIDSDNLSLDDLLKLTKLIPNETNTIGDYWSKGKFQYSCNSLIFESYNEPGNIESKILFLLDLLEQDFEGIKKLAELTDSKDIWLSISYHKGDWNFSKLYLTTEIIQRLANFGFSLTFDFLIRGKEFIDLDKD